MIITQILHLELDSQLQVVTQEDLVPTLFHLAQVNSIVLQYKNYCYNFRMQAYLHMAMDYYCHIVFVHYEFDQ